MALDNLYASAITDMRKEIPNVKKGRYLSFEKLGLGDHLTDEKLSRLQQIIRTERDSSRWPQLFEQAGIADIPRTLEFLNHFDCTIISDTTLPEETIQTSIAAMEPLNTQEYRNLKNIIKWLNLIRIFILDYLLLIILFITNHIV